MLAHCLWVAEWDQGYALYAAERYERDSEGILIGLHDRVKRTIDRWNLEQKKEKNHEL